MADYRDDSTRDKMSLLGVPTETVLTLLTALKKLELKRRKSMDEGEDESSLLSEARSSVVTMALGTMTIVGVLVYRLFSSDKGEQLAKKDEAPVPQQSWWSSTISSIGSLFTSSVPVPESAITIKEHAPSVPVPAPFALSSVSDDVQKALAEASKGSGISQPVLYAVANKESKLGKMNISMSSSARGILQMLPKSYKEMVKKYGKELGIGPNDIDSNRANAIMGALYLRGLAETYRRNVGGNPSVTQLYIMYLMGPYGGLRFLKAMEANPKAIAADETPQAAAANPGVFYSRDGGKRTARSYAEVFSYLSREVEDVSTAVRTNFPQLASTDAFVSPPQTLALNTPKINTVGPSNTLPIPAVLNAPQSQQSSSVVEQTQARSADETTSSPMTPVSVKKPQTVVRTATGLMVGI